MRIMEIIKERPLIFDGAMGTMLQKACPNLEGVPERYNFTMPDVIKDIHLQYLRAGCDVVSTNTFGANRLKLEGCGYTPEEMITKAVGLAKESINEHGGVKFAALSLGPIGQLMAPAGELEFEMACDLYREQLIAGVNAGADLILIETQSDIYELKAAIVTARELTADIPIFCTVTFQEDGRMLMGTDPVTMVTSLQDLGIDAIGINCSLGPEQMVPIVKEILKYSKLPVIVQPNAGLPKMIKGETAYDIDAEQYAETMADMIMLGVGVVGGCCGTTPEYINKLNNRIKSIDNITEIIKNAEINRLAPSAMAVTSSTKTVFLDNRIKVIGERINPTGKKLLKEALKAEDFAYIENEAISQVNFGADILDVNVGLPGIDEKETMLKVIKRISAVTDAPLQVDSADPHVIAAAARYYNGRPIINSVNGKQEVMDAVFPIVKKYGTCVIALTLDEKGLPESANDRVEIAGRIIKEAKRYGIGPDRILVDCLTLTVSAQQSAGMDTLLSIGKVKSLYGVKTTLGASNVSFGLPERKLLNSTFLAMALYAGLDAPITDPLSAEYMDVIRAYETLSAKDVDSKEFIAHYGGTKSTDMDYAKKEATDSVDGECTAAEKELTNIIISGFGDRAEKATVKLLKHKKPLDIVETIIIPALEIVGKEYEEGGKFLPQLVQSADSVKPAFDAIKAHMAKEGASINYGKIILATVKGDIHDIGKNIVKVLLENYGYEVLDLGKDVDIDIIVDTAKAEGIKLVGLSALMTTTVVNMEASIKALRKAGLNCKIAVGGAVLSPEYASSIGADFYCKDAMDGVRVANSIFKVK
jgi:5-methyltetrahydrofolate--homocysteine methyltransferase